MQTAIDRAEAEAQPVPEPFRSIDEVLEHYPFFTRQQLAGWRFKGIGPRWYRPTGRLILYKFSQIDEWIAEGERQGTAEGAA